MRGWRMEPLMRGSSVWACVSGPFNSRDASVRRAARRSSTTSTAALRPPSTGTRFVYTMTAPDGSGVFRIGLTYRMAVQIQLKVWTFFPAFGGKDPTPGTTTCSTQTDTPRPADLLRVRASRHEGQQAERQRFGHGRRRHQRRWAVYGRAGENRKRDRRCSRGGWPSAEPGKPRGVCGGSLHGWS